VANPFPFVSAHVCREAAERWGNPAVGGGFRRFEVVLEVGHPDSLVRSSAFQDFNRTRMQALIVPRPLTWSPWTLLGPEV
jgi:hypothetical protein